MIPPTAGRRPSIAFLPAPAVTNVGEGYGVVPLVGAPVAECLEEVVVWLRVVEVEWIEEYTDVDVLVTEYVVAVVEVRVILVVSEVDVSEVVALVVDVSVVGVLVEDVWGGMTLKVIVAPHCDKGTPSGQHPAFVQ